MGQAGVQPWSSEVWELARRQHGVVAREQLITSGMSSDAIQHRVERGRLHRLWRGVYAVGRPEVSERGRWLAAVLTCGPDARLSHCSAARLWGFQLRRPPMIDVAVPSRVARRGRRGIRVHRQAHFEKTSQRVVDRIPVTDPVSTLVDLASCLSGAQLERAVNEADRLDLVDPETLRDAVAALPSRPGTGRLRQLLDHHTRTDTGLERRFLGLVRSAGLPIPETQIWLHGYRVDFFWPDRGLIVETDGLRYHRTPSQQAEDRRRDQIHTAAGLTTVRFAEAQIRSEADHVKAVLADVISRLSGDA